MQSEVQAVVIGGGRSPATQPLSRAAASSYADLLRSEPAAPPVFAALGTGDAGSEPDGPLKRQTFVEHVIDPLKPASAVDPTSRAPRLVEVPGDPQPDEMGAAYAFDVPGTDGGAARVVVIDNTTKDTLRGGLDGPQGQWLIDVLRDAAAAQRAVVVVGAAPIDVPDAAGARHSELLPLLARYRVAAYVSTDGSDDRQSLRFGMRERTRTIDVEGTKLLVVHSSTLGHAMPAPVWNGLSRFGVGSDDDSDEAQAVRDYRERGGSLVELTLPAAAGTARPRAESVSVVSRIDVPDLTDVYLGVADPIWLPTVNESENGVRWLDPDNPAEGDRVTSGDGRVQYTVSAICNLFSEEAECDGDLPAAWEFQTEDPSIARFVRADIRKPRGNDRNGNEGAGERPVVVTDAQGNPIIDSKSQVLCPLKVGTTWASVTSGGETVRWQVRVIPPKAGILPAQPGGAKCEFIWAQPRPEEAVPEPKPAVPAFPKPVVIPTLPTPEPGPVKVKSPQPKPQLVPAPLLFVPPIDATPMPMRPTAAPPLAISPKPIQPPANPTPPSGVTTQQVPVPQVQVAPGLQRERSREVAHEGLDYQATAYTAEPSPTVPLVVAGGALALLFAAAGHLSGRRRALARSAARRFLR